MASNLAIPVGEQGGGKPAPHSPVKPVLYTDFSNAIPQKFDDFLKLSNSFKKVSDKTDKTVQELTGLFKAHRIEEISPKDLSTIQDEFIILDVQLNTDGGTFNQQLPSHTEGKMIIMRLIYATGVNSGTLTITPATGEQINGSSKPVSTDSQGFMGVFIPLESALGYEFIPQSMVHDIGITFSDNAGNFFLGEQHLKFADGTLGMKDGVLTYTPAIPLNIVDDGGADTTGVNKINFKGATVSYDKVSGTTTVEFPNSSGTSIKGVDDEKREFPITKIQSLDKRIRISNLGGGVCDLDIDDSGKRPDGIFAKLGNPQDVNTDWRNLNPYVANIYDNTGRNIGLGLNSSGEIAKNFTLQYGGDEDPNLIAGTTIRIGFYLEFMNKNVAPKSGYVEIKLINSMTKDYVFGDDGLPIAIRVDYQKGAIMHKEYLIREVTVKGQIQVAFEIDTNMSGQILELGPKTCFFFQEINKKFHTGICEMMWEQLTGITINKFNRYYGENFMNFAREVVKTKSEIEISNTREQLGNGLILDILTKAKVSISEYHLNISAPDDLTLPSYYVGRIFNRFDTYNLRGKQMKTDVILTDKDNAFDYSLIKWIGQGEPKLPIITGYTTGGMIPQFNQGWTKVDTAFISEDVVVGDHKSIHTFTVPIDADQFALILYPSQLQAPSTLKMKDFESDVTPSFTKSFIADNSHIDERVLFQQKGMCKSVVMTPAGQTSYRYTVNNVFTPLPVGVFKGCDGIENDNSWHDAGSFDPNKVQGNIKFTKEMADLVSYTALILNEKATTDTATLKVQKVNDNGTYTDIADSVYTVQLPNTKVPTLARSKHFNISAKENETYRFGGISNTADGFYLQSTTNGQPMIEFIHEYVELTERDKMINKLLNP